MFLYFFFKTPGERKDAFSNIEGTFALQPLHHLMSTKDEEWHNVLHVQNDDVVLRDRLMTDAALGGPRPIKSEHSYSLLTSSPPPSPATPGGNPYTPNASSSAGVVGSTTASTAATIDFVQLHHKPLELLRTRIDGKDIYIFLS